MAIEFAGELHNNVGVAIAGAYVDLFARNTANQSTASPSSPDTTTTDGDGKWSFSKAAQGRYDIRITSGTSVRWRKYDDAIQMEEIEVAMLAMRNPGDTFKYDVTPGAILADQVLNLPVTTQTTTVVSTPVEDAKDISLGAGSDFRLRWSTGDSDNHAAVLALGDSNEVLHITNVADIATDWNVSANAADAEVWIHSDTTPATDYLVLGRHTGTVATIDVQGGTTLNLDIAGNTELTVTSAGLNVPANSDINFTGTTGTNDITLTDSLADALSITRAGTDMVVFKTSSTPSITFTPATTFSGGIANAGTIAAGTWNGTDVGVAYGGTGASTLTDGGVLLGSGTGAITAMTALSDSEMIVGNGSTDPVAESGATLRTSIGVGTTDSPTFTALTLSDGQLVFPATQNASAGANTLDDYEEGTWTPTMVDLDSSNKSQAYSTQTGRYTKVGNRCYIQGRMGLSNLGSLDQTEQARIAALPFTPANVSEATNTVSFGLATGLALPNASESVTGTIGQNDPHLNLENWSVTTGTANVVLSEVSADGFFIFSGWYEV
jgi:hypothetical protein